ncbi:MAG: phosphodiester glycosidase family protein [Oscillospiraceae bacterium]|nr:phosphodiester glycosidase family protein [Oscillospiraceae bacterium]
MAGKREIGRSEGSVATHNQSTGERGPGKRVIKTKKAKRRIIKALIAVVILVALYLTAVYSNIPFIKKWRTIYIETAMSTQSHQWLATYFIPKSVIDEVMAQVEADLNSQVGLSSLWDTEETEEVEETETAEVTETTVVEETEAVETTEPEEAEDAETTAFFETYWELDSTSIRSYLSKNSSLVADGYDSLYIDNSSGKLDLETVNGDEIYVIDAENNLFIVTVTGSNFQGKLAVVKNAAQVDLVKSSSLGSYGQLLTTLASNNNAVLAMNCSGFGDTDGHGTGGYVMGSLIIDGVEYGNPQSGTWKLFGFKDDDRLYIMDYSSSAKSSFRWAAQFFPALVINGSSVVDGTFGMGLQPRACFGQTKNGDVLMLVVDGRQVGYSIGCTVEDCTEILLDYDAYQAMNLDGGSSALMVYKGTKITSPSSVSSEGRYLPDALIVRYASDVD